MGSLAEKNEASPALLPYSLSQQEVWLDQRAWPGSTHLNIGGAVSLHGPLDVQRLRHALRLLVHKHDTLRLLPQLGGGQRLLDSFEPTLNLRPPELGANLPSIRKRWADRLREPFALHLQPPWRFDLLCYGPDQHDLSIQFHHLIMDGWGTTLILRSWSEIYEALLHEATLPSIAQQVPSYLDFISESNNYRNSSQHLRDLEFWRGQITPKPRALRLRSGGNRPRQSLPKAHTFKVPLGRREFDTFAAMCKALGYSPVSGLLAALAFYFWRTEDRNAVLIGLPSLNRAGRRFLGTPGMFASVLPLRIDLQTASTAAELLSCIHKQIQSALRHASCPLSEIASQSGGAREGQASLIDVMLSFERQDYDFAFGEARLCHPCQLFSEHARYPLAVTLCEFGRHSDPVLVVEASEDYFDRQQAQVLGQRLWTLAQALATEPHQPLAELDLLFPEERWALLEGLHQNLAELDAPQPYVDLFERHAALRPERCALVWQGGQMSYGELAGEAEALAVQLRALGAGPNKVVAMALERSAEMVIALLAISRAGAAFLPLDPQAPLARLAGILIDSAAIALVLDASSPHALQALHERCLTVTRACQPLSKTAANEGAIAAAQGHPSRSQPEGAWPRAGVKDLAYVLFTSGSSGRPKGVMVEHGALSRRLAWMAKTWSIQAEDRSAQGTQLSFDPALIELCLPLSQGASIALPPPGRLHPQRLAEFIVRFGATFSAFVPSTLPGLLSAWQSLGSEKSRKLRLRVACCGGDVLSPALAERFVRETGAQLYNVYGPTEATIFASAWPCHALSGRGEGSTAPDLPIGRPIDDTRLYVLGPQLQVLPHGVVGELYIGGKALARGYLGRPELDAQHFLPDPFVQTTPGQYPPRLYRSGDLAWIDGQGRLHFSGRIDRQIKLRGYRIELGDVEAACLKLPGVEQAAVQLLHPNGQAPYLQACLGGQGLDPAQVLAGLRSLLPDYMRPSRLHCLQALPLKANGKLDWAALPSETPPPSGAGNTEPQAPRTPLERRLHALWRQALQAPTEVGAASAPRVFGVHDNFFDLGGDSLSALSILDQLESELGRPLPLQLLAEHPSIAELALALGRSETQMQGLLALGDATEPTQPHRMRVFLAASGCGDILRLQNLAAALQGEAELFMLQAPTEPAPTTMKEFASIYADTIEAHAPGGSAFWLAGFSVGGVTALATARELQGRGRPPQGLMLLDTIHPDAVFGGAAAWRTLGWLVRKLHMQELSMNGRRLSAMFSDPGLVSQVMALRGHQCQAFQGPVLLIKSSGLAGWSRLLFQAWHRMMPRQLSSQTVSGLHGSMFEPVHVLGLAQAMRQFMHEPHLEESKA